jgi:5-methylcytosine-specific restriction endonuclease McrA
MSEEFIYPARKQGARGKIRAFLEANVGKVITTDQISQIADIRDYQRRIRELRNEEGMQIRSHHDLASLKPGEYMLETLDRLPAIERSISPQLRNDILERNGFTCQQCGSGAGDPDPYNPGRKVRLHVDHIIPISQGGTDDRDNLRALCSTCNQGKSNIQAPSESALNILARVRKTPRSVQREIYETLKRTFGDA